MSTVVVVEAKGETAAILVMDDGARVWTPDKAKAEALVGKPIPADWTQKQGEYGPQAFPPREGKGVPSVAFRNTKEAFLLEQDSIHRSVALQQAVTASVDLGTVLKTADRFYAWLSKSPAPGIESPTGHAGNTGGRTTHPPEAGTSSASSLGGQRDLAIPPVTAPPRIQDAGAGEGADSSSGSSQVSARGESDSIVEGGESPAATGKSPGAPPQCPKCGSDSAPSPKLKGWQICVSSTCRKAWKP